LKKSIPASKRPFRPGLGSSKTVSPELDNAPHCLRSGFSIPGKLATFSLEALFQWTAMTITEFQRRIEAIYLERDRARGVDGCFRWLVEEVGELARALRNREAAATALPDANLREEFADVLAWLTTLASVTGVDLAAAAKERYDAGCPKCAAVPCSCPT
jgi:NTP pyrophosphatase (non-canonical NTP hydrolase)